MDNDALYLNRQLANLQTQETRAIAAESGLLPVHIDVLRYLERANRYSNTPAAVAKYLHLTKGTVSQSIKLLEREKLLAKRRDEEDKRVIRLSITAAGRRLVESIDGRLLDAVEQAPLPNGATREFADAARQLLRGLQAANDYRSFGVCKSCRFFTVNADKSFRCGLTDEALSVDDSTRICQEHEYA